MVTSVCLLHLACKQCFTLEIKTLLSSQLIFLLDCDSSCADNLGVPYRPLIQQSYHTRNPG